MIMVIIGITISEVTYKPKFNHILSCYAIILILGKDYCILYKRQLNIEHKYLNNHDPLRRAGFHYKHTNGLSYLFHSIF